MKGLVGNISGIPVFEDKFIREGTYVCLDKNNLPIKIKNFNKTKIKKILVKNIKTFKMVIKNNKTNNL